MSGTSGFVQSLCFPPQDGAASYTINETVESVELTNLYNGAKFLYSSSEGCQYGGASHKP